MRILFKCFLLCVLVCSCSSNNDVKKQLEKMHGSSVHIPLDSMLCWHPSDEDYSSSRADSKWTLVVYADTSDCSTCYLEHLQLWNDFVKMEKDHEGIIRFLFIIEARAGEAKGLYKQMGLTNLKHSIYVDGNKSFSRNNPQIPSSKLCHTFLLNDKNEVVLVGSPVYNEKIEAIFKRKVEESLKSSQ